MNERTNLALSLRVAELDKEVKRLNMKCENLEAEYNLLYEATKDTGIHS